MSFLKTIVAGAFAALVAFSATAQDGDELGEAIKRLEPLDLTEFGKVIDDNKAKFDKLAPFTPETVLTVEQAHERIDEIIATYQSMVDSYGSDSEQVGKMDEFIAAYKDIAGIAGQHPNAEIRKLSEQFLEKADTVAELKVNFIEEARKAAVIIRELKDQKELASYLFLLDQGDQVIAALKQQLQIARDTNVAAQAQLDRIKGVGGIPVVTEPVEQ